LTEAEPPVHVAQISFFTDPLARSPERLLRDWPSLVDVAECAVRADARVSVIQASHHSQSLLRDGVSYHFLPFGRTRPVVKSAAGFGQLLSTLAPDVLHVHGLDFAQDVAALAAAAPGIPIFLQDHASRPPRWWRRPSWRRGFAAASGIAFCSLDQAKPFTAADLLPSTTLIFAIPESTSRFVPGDKDSARRSLQVAGNPLILWVGHLDGNKDPLTVLEGVSRAARALPQLKLYCCYGTAPLLKAVQDRIARDPLLRGRVHQFMQAADVFVSGSHREGSGYSVIEALACGLPPVVTDIASFRALTGSGSVGALWPSGDASALCDQLSSIVARPRLPLRAAARRHFVHELSFDAVGRKLLSAYQELLERRPIQCASGQQRSDRVPKRA
jgi:glycosyltransferase involved in cell wall biosynthesis